MHPASHQFGTDVERIEMPFRDFLTSLRNEDGHHHYLTTQYAEQDSDAQTVLPPPTDSLVGDYPLVPRIMGNLFLQQVNLWLGKSREGSTSGLVCFPSAYLPHSNTDCFSLSITTSTIIYTAFCVVGNGLFSTLRRRYRISIRMASSTRYMKTA